MRCVLVGNYGVGNLGDEALREFFLKEFTEVEWIVVSGNLHAPNEVPRLPLGLRSLFKPWRRTINAIRQSDAVVFGGGSLFTDTESAWACVVWGAYALAARLFGKPYYLAFQGIGPFRTLFGHVMTQIVCSHAAFISVRDEESMKRILPWKTKLVPLLTFDPAFSLFATFMKGLPDEKLLAIIPRANATEDFFRAAAEKMKAHNRVLVLLLEPAQEQESVKRLQTLQTKPLEIIPVHSVTALMEALSRASEVLTQRYHGGLAALALGIPVTAMPQRPNDKLSTLRDLGETIRTEELLLTIREGSKKFREALGKYV